MDNCPKCGGPVEIDYDSEEDPYIICTKCDWCEEEEEDET